MFRSVDHSARSLAKPAGASGPTLVARSAECDRFWRVFELAGGLRTMCLVGDAGIGKTSIIRQLSSTAVPKGARVFGCRPSQADAHLSFCALTDLLAEVETNELAFLPRPQRNALTRALLRDNPYGSVDAPDEPPDAPPDARTLATALVTLLRSLAASGTIVVVLDDVQWLDAATTRTLEFAVRRLIDADIVVLVGCRNDENSAWKRISGAVPLDRAWTETLGPLDPDALGVVLAQHRINFSGPQIRQIHRASGGNPFHAVELSREIATRAQDEFDVTAVAPARIRERIAQRINDLPTHTRRELVRAAVITTRNANLLDLQALLPAEEAGIMRFGASIEFVHPLYAAGVVDSTPANLLRSVHGELADLVDGVEERAEHLFRASLGPSEHVALASIAAADTAWQRGALDKAAVFRERAIRCTAPASTVLLDERRLAAARSQLRIGDAERAKALALVVRATSNSTHRAEATQVLGEAAMQDDMPEGVRLLEEASALASGQPALVAEIQAVLASLRVGIFDMSGALGHGRQALEQAEEAGLSALISQALSMVNVTGLFLGLGADESQCRRALELEDRLSGVGGVLTRPSLVVAMIYEYTGKIVEARAIFLELQRWLAERGVDDELAYVGIHLAVTSELLGDYNLARVEATSALRSAEASGQEVFRSFALMVRGVAGARLGELAEAQADLNESLDIATRIGWVMGVMQAQWGLGHVALSVNDTGRAARLLEASVAGVALNGVYEWPIAMAVPDAIEAFVAAGELERAAELGRAFSNWAPTFNRSWAVALSARCEAIVFGAQGELASAESSARRAVEAHAYLPMPFELARTLLLLGQVERRRGQRRAARYSLERSVEMFRELGCVSWEYRARAELRRIGVRKPGNELSENEHAAAQLAADGHSNSDIAARLFISQRTVESNLARAYRKLGVDSRVALASLIARERAASPD